MKRRAFFLTWIGTILTGVGVGLVALAIAGDGDGDDAGLLIILFAVLGAFLGPFVGLVAIFVFKRAERWVLNNNVDDERARRVFMKVGAAFLPVAVVIAVFLYLLFGSGDTPDLVPSLVAIVIVMAVAAVIGALGGSLIWKRRAEAPSAAPA